MDMKKNILLIALLGISLVSCYKSQLDPVSGMFPVPTEVKASEFTAASATSVKGEQGRLIDVDLKSNTASVHLAIVGNKYYLTENVYLGALEATATSGTFIAAKTTVNGIGIKEGRITVSRVPVDTEKKTYSLDDIYTINAVLLLVDGAPVKFEWTGKLEFHPDPVIGDIIVENTMADAASATQAGKMKHLITLVDGDGNPSGTFEIYTEVDATSIAGTYVCKEFAENLGEAGIIANGFNIPDWGVSGGSYFMKDGARVDIAPGQIVVIAPLTDKSYVFNVAGTDIVVAGSEMGEGVVFGTAGADAVSTTQAGKNKHLVTVTEDDAPAGTFELYTEVDADITGTYVCKEFAEGLGESLIIANGYNIPDWGVSGGSYYMKDGVRVDINPGELVTVVKAGEKLYSFCGNGFTYLVKFKF